MPSTMLIFYYATSVGKNKSLHRKGGPNLM